MTSFSITYEWVNLVLVSLLIIYIFCFLLSSPLLFSPLSSSPLLSFPPLSSCHSLLPLSFPSLPSTLLFSIFSVYLLPFHHFLSHSLSFPLFLPFLIVLYISSPLLPSLPTPLLSFSFLSHLGNAPEPP